MAVPQLQGKLGRRVLCCPLQEGNMHGVGSAPKGGKKTKDGG